MSKVVKGVGRAIGKVVDGVKKFAKSKLGKVLIGAALVYFGGAALMGAMGSTGAAAAGGLSGLSGAAANVSAAWTSLGTAGSQLLAGNLGNAASALGSGIGGSAATMGAEGLLVNGMAQAAPMAVQTAAPTAKLAATPAGAFTGQTMTGLPTVAGDAANVLKAGAGSGGSGLISGAANWFNSLTPAQQALTAQAGAGAASTGLKMYGAYKTGQEQEQAAEDQRARYNRNIGGFTYA